MLKTIYTGKSRLTLSLCLTGLLSLFCAAPSDAAQDAPPNASFDDQSGSSAPNAPRPDQPSPPAPDQSAAPDSNQPDPPSRVARISYLEGSISFQPGGEGDWGNAVKNRPVTVGDKVWSDKDSRAELETGQASLHLGSMTALSFLNLDGDIMQVRIAEGSVNFRIREMREGDLYEVDTPNVAFIVKQAGAFRIDVAENGDGTRVTAIRGEGEVTAAGQTYTVHPNERAEFNGVDNSVQYNVHGAPPPDGLDRWSNDRDLREDNSVSAKYVNRDVPGYSDLDDHGTWSEQPPDDRQAEQGQRDTDQRDQGPVWYPNDVPDGWAPYSDGYWNYVGPWGWSWVGYEPWGFAPYHYGRWNYFGGRWGWYPGPIWARPYYGPAFVGFLGGGFGFGVGFGGGFGFGGGIGWFPLGCGEPFHPWYHAGAGYIRTVNINNTRINNVNISNKHFNYAYAHSTNAVTAASRNTFANGERVNRGAARVTAASLQNARVSSTVNVSPNRSSYTGAASLSGRVATPSSTLQNRSVVARTKPSAAASHSPVRNLNPAPASANRGNAANGATRTWSAQGNTTDRGVAPQGAGRPSNPPSDPTQTTRLPRSDRPAQSARSLQSSGTTPSRSYGRSTTSYNRPPSATADRSYQPPRSVPSYNGDHGASQPQSYSAPGRGYSRPYGNNSAPSRGYSRPSGNNSTASRGSSAPSRSSGGGGSSGGGSRGGGSGSPHGGGGGRH